MDVVILAAGASRRFGQSKQFLPVTPDGKTLLEITAGNARRAGCDRAVIVTAPGCEDDTRALFETRPVDGLEIKTASQHPDDLPAPSPVTRELPWGTAHALWAARHAVTGPFLVFNADDDYGPNAAATILSALNADAGGTRFVILGYPLGETLSPEGAVSRAVCETGDGGRLVALSEYSGIDTSGTVVSGDNKGRALPLDSLVSMNAWGFTPDIFPLIEKSLRDFLAGPDAETGECYLPVVVDTAVRAGAIEVRVVAAPDRWCGLTWPGDRDRVVRRLAEQTKIRKVAEYFGLDPADSAPVPFGDGLINSTWRLETKQGRHLMQLINRKVFPDPVAVAENAAAAAARIDDALRRGGDDDPRHRLVFLDGPDGLPWLRYADGDIWRVAVMVPNARPADPARPAEVRGAARALGRFPGLVAGGTGPELKETIPGFHDTPARLAALFDRADADVSGRLDTCEEEFDVLTELASLASRLKDTGLPVRPVHNDAKLDNVLVDRDSGEVLCVVDLDTVMPGLAVHDFGDLVRSAVTGRPEDEPDLDRIALRESTFCDLAAGYLEGASGWIEEIERSKLIDGAIVITFEQAVRFLSDYLDGDSYFPVSDDDHNLRRTRAQLRLLEELLDAEDEMRRFVEDVRKNQA